MAAIDTPPAPAAPAAPAPASIPAPTSTIRVSQMPAPAAPAAPAKPGSAKERMRQSLEKIAKPIEGTDDRPPAPAPKAADKPAGDEPPAPAPDPNAPPADPNAPPAPTAEPKGKERVSPWKLFEQEKAARAKAEKEIQDLKASIVPEAERKTLVEKMQATEKRAQELEEHIRFVDYRKSAEFQEKYEVPYQKAWSRAMGELGQLTVTDPGTQQPRAVTSEDILELVNLPLQKAREVADAVFGPFANDVMGHRKEIRNLFDAQASALEDAKKNGSERIKQAQEFLSKQNEELRAHIETTWNKLNEEALADPKVSEYFKPREGEEEWNQRLAKGFELADRAFKENPNNPKLTPEQRISAIKRHVALKNRAAGWGPLKWENGQLKTQLAELKAELEKYKGSEPTAGGTRTPANGSGPVSGMDRIRQGLQKIARPGN